ncbi:MAG TPA: ABC transporter permease, partial [Bryobacteraceae bacterium]|nr:ABC transporter permease [Bryobacteraceae bacterium]
MTESLLRAWRRVRYRWHRRELARELAEELDFHYERKLAENLGSGVPAPEAKNISRRQMGNITAAEEECWDMWSITSLERLLQDLKHASRMYLRTPMVTGICVLSIAIGIGGNAAMFSLVNGLLLRPLPYNDPDKLVRITGVYPRAAVPFFQGRSRVMDVAAVSPGSEANLTIREQPLRVLGSFVSPNFLAVLGRSVAFGRTFEAREDAPGSDQVLVISHSLWQQQFGGELSALGQRVRLDGVDREIVGILPQGFSYPSPKVQFWAPMRLDPSNFVQFWGGPFIPLIARIREGRTLVDAQADVQRMASEFRHQFPYPMPRDFNASSTAISLQEDLVGNVRGRLLILLASVAAVLLIAGANVTSILLSRSVARRKELALRAALGAGRGRIIRQLLTESVGLSATGAALGILLGTFLLSIFKRVLPAELPGVAQAEIDWPVIGAI